MYIIKHTKFSFTDYVPSILPWNDSHRPETEEELQEFNAMMETKKREIQSIIDVRHTRTWELLDYALKLPGKKCKICRKSSRC